MTSPRATCRVCGAPALTKRGTLCAEHRAEISRRNGSRSGTTRVTEKHKTTFVDALREGDAVEIAARKSRIPRRTLQYHRERDERFALEWAAAAEEGCGVVEQRIVDIALGRVPRASMVQLTACFGILRARRPDVWREGSRIELGVAQNQPIEVKLAFDLPQTTKEQLGAPRQQRALPHGA